MRTILFVLLSFIFSVSSVFADHSHQKILLDANLVKIEVKGIVCSFCAYGIQKKLSKLKFLDRSKLKKGVHVDINNQQLTLALEGDRYIDLKKVYTAIKKGGYEPTFVHIHVKGVVTQMNDKFVIKDERHNLMFSSNDESVGKWLDKVIEMDVHFKADLIPDIDLMVPIPISINQIIES